MAEEINNPENITIVKSWVGLYSDKLYSRAYYMTNNKEAAEDLVQETFLAALKGFEKFKGQSNPLTWLLAIINYKIIDYHRLRYKYPTINIENPIGNGNNKFPHIFFDEDGRWRDEQRPLDWAFDEGHLLDNPAFNETLKKCMEQLPAQWFSAIQLKYLEEEDSSTICQDLSISATNYWQILHRAKLQLRKCLEMKWFKSKV